MQSFPFPVSSEDVDLSDAEEDMITDISEHVTVMTGQSCMISQYFNLHYLIYFHISSSDGENAGPTYTANNEKTAQHFSYPIPQANQNFHGQFTTLAEVTSYPSQTLPPASTLTKSDPSNALEYPTFRAHKTFIVPLTSSAHPSVPVVVDPNPSQIDQSQVPGMMVTYMMPPQPYVS